MQLCAELIGLSCTVTMDTPEYIDFDQKMEGYRCAVCGFDFYETYGEIGKDFIHIHHLKPLADLGGEKEVAVDDLRPVCPNCHAMLHRKKKGVYSISELRKKIRKKA